MDTIPPLPSLDGPPPLGGSRPPNVHSWGSDFGSDFHTKGSKNFPALRAGGPGVHLWGGVVVVTMKTRGKHATGQARSSFGLPGPWVHRVSPFFLIRFPLRCHYPASVTPRHQIFDARFSHQYVVLICRKYNFSILNNQMLCLFFFGSCTLTLFSQHTTYIFFA